MGEKQSKDVRTTLVRPGEPIFDVNFREQINGENFVTQIFKVTKDGQTVTFDLDIQDFKFVQSPGGIISLSVPGDSQSPEQLKEFAFPGSAVFSMVEEKAGIPRGNYTPMIRVAFHFDLRRARLRYGETGQNLVFLQNTIAFNPPSRSGNSFSYNTYRGNVKCTVRHIEYITASLGYRSPTDVMRVVLGVDDLYFIEF